MQYLERRALKVARPVFDSLKDALAPQGFSVTEPEADDLFMTERHDRGAVLFVFDRNGDPVADIQVQVPCAQGFGDDGGWGFGFACSDRHGAIGPGGILYNYTPGVWTADRDEIRSRLDWMMESARDFADACAEWIATTARPLTA